MMLQHSWVQSGAGHSEGVQCCQLVHAWYVAGAEAPWDATELQHLQVLQGADVLQEVCRYAIPTSFEIMSVWSAPTECLQEARVQNVDTGNPSPASDAVLAGTADRPDRVSANLQHISPNLVRPLQLYKTPCWLMLGPNRIRIHGSDQDMAYEIDLFPPLFALSCTVDVYPICKDSATFIISEAAALHNSVSVTAVQCQAVQAPAFLGRSNSCFCSFWTAYPLVFLINITPCGPRPPSR